MESKCQNKGVTPEGERHEIVYLMEENKWKQKKNRRGPHALICNVNSVPEEGGTEVLNISNKATQ